MPYSITVIYFAQLQDDAGCAEERLELSEQQTLATLFAELAAKHSFTVEQADIRPTKNHDFVEWADPILDGDTICFLPPVSGG